MMQLYLNEIQREEITVTELARLIFRLVKGQSDKRSNQFEEPIRFSLPNLLERLCPGNKDGGEVNEPSFFLKFYEAVAQLKRLGLLMEAFDSRYGNRSCVCLTSVGEQSDFDEDLLILVDDPYKTVTSVKETFRTLTLLWNNTIWKAYVLVGKDSIFHLLFVWGRRPRELSTVWQKQ